MCFEIVLETDKMLPLSLAIISILIHTIPFLRSSYSIITFHTIRSPKRIHTLLIETSQTFKLKNHKLLRHLNLKIINYLDIKT